MMNTWFTIDKMILNDLGTKTLQLDLEPPTPHLCLMT